MTSKIQNTKIQRTVFIEFVRLLYTARWPIVVVGAAILTVGVAVGRQTGDVVAPLIGFTGLLVSIARLVLCSVFDHTVARRPLDLAAAKRWEYRLGIGVIATGVCVGGFAVRGFMLPDITAHMVAGSLVFGYCAGTTTRFSIRPWIVKASIAVAAIPAILGALWNFDLMHVAQAMLFLIFFLGAFELISYIHDTTVEQLTLRAEAAHLARLDVLTRLPNRLHLDEHFDELTAQMAQRGDGFALISIDLDFFKDANDRFGHAAGDQILRLVADRLTATIGDDDLAARIGGDEFVVIQAHVIDSAGAEQLGHRIVAALSEPYPIDGATALLGASFGVALAPQDGTTLGRLLRKADASLYTAKRNRPARRRNLVTVDDIPLVPCLSAEADHRIA